MKQNEREEPQDDLEFEITNLDEAKGDALHTARLPEKPIFLLRKHKGLVTATSTLLVILAILLILFSVAPIRQLIISAPVQNTFDYRLDASPPWGHLFVDGQPARLPSSTTYPLFSLTRGEHTLLWRANPFSPQQCVIMVPVGSGVDTCKHPQIPLVSGGTDSYISFPTDMALLSPARRVALLQATQQALDSQQSSEIMRSGDMYAQTSETTGANSPSCTVLQIAAFCLANAHQPLVATLRLQLDTSSWSRVSCWRGECESNGQNCHLFCGPFLYASPDVQVSPRLWQATVYAQLFWRFSTLDGRVVVDNQADTFIRGQQNETLMPLNIAWDGQYWGVEIGDYAYSGDPVCEAAMGDLSNLENAKLATSDQQTVTTMHAIRGTTLASGCLVEFKLQTGAFPIPTSTSPPPLIAYVIQRFGVLLAVDSVAHHLFPFLPVATSYEKQLARQWAARQSPIINVQVSVISG